MYKPDSAGAKPFYKGLPGGETLHADPAFRDVMERAGNPVSFGTIAEVVENYASSLKRSQQGPPGPIGEHIKAARVEAAEAMRAYAEENMPVVGYGPRAGPTEPDNSPTWTRDPDTGEMVGTVNTGTGLEVVVNGHGPDSTRPDNGH